MKFLCKLVDPFGESEKICNGKEELFRLMPAISNATDSDLDAIDFFGMVLSKPFAIRITVKKLEDDS